MKLFTNISILVIAILFSSLSTGVCASPDSIPDFEEDKQAMIISLQNQIEELHSDLSRLEIEIHTHNEDVSITTEDIVDANYIRLEDIINELEAELKTVNNATQEDWEKLKEAEIKRRTLKDESVMLIRKIEEKLNKNTRKS